MTPEDEPTDALNASNAGEPRRAIFVKAARIGTAVPVIMTIGGRAALAGNGKSLTASCAASHAKNKR